MSTEATASAAQARPHSGKRMLRNVVWNLSGVLLPLVAAAFCAPVLLEELGGSRFGLLALAWTLIGYFSIFDLGMGRSVAKLVSHELGAGRTERIAGIVWTAVLSALALGLFGGLALGLGAQTLVAGLAGIDAGLSQEALRSLWVLAAALPAVVAGTALSGALEAYQRFDIVNLLRTPAGLINFMAPLAVLPFTRDLTYVILVLAVCKLVVTLCYLLACRKVVTGFGLRPEWSSGEFSALLKFGGWITLGNLLNPIVAYTDRFLISAFVPLAVVGHYVLPYEVLMRILVPVVAITAVMFPAFSTALAQDETRVRDWFGLSVKTILIGAFPATFVIALWSYELLELWLNPEAAATAHVVTKLFALGICLTCLNQVSLTLIQAKGHPDWLPKLLLAELPVYLPVLVWATRNYGIEGAATAWLLRILVDFIFLFWNTGAGVAFISQVANRMLPLFLLVFGCFALSLLQYSPQTRISLTLLAITIFLALAWRCFEPTEKNLILGLLKRKKP